MSSHTDNQSFSKQMKSIKIITNDIVEAAKFYVRIQTSALENETSPGEKQHNNR